ncbi:MAG: DUF4340 domain-containing protein [Verrucomicrobiota bacterium]|nr:DUF4340 domain-containing protein [Verrucomicrobiota bacterium]
MKSKKNLLLFIIAGALFAFIWFHERKEVSFTEKEANAKKVFTFKDDSVKTLNINTGTQTISLKRDKTDWTIVSPIASPADNMEADTIVRELSQLTIQRKMSPEELSPEAKELTGINKPAARIEGTSDNEKFLLKIGNESPTGDGLYVQKDGDPSIYVVNKGVKKTLIRPLDDLRRRVLIEITPKAITKIEFKQRSGTESRVTELVRDQNNRWRLVKPITGTADTDKINDLISRLDTGRIESFVAEDKADLKAYGLAEPAHEITIYQTTGIQSQTIQLGVAQPDQKRTYARIQNQPAVFTIPSDLASEISIGLTDLRNHKVMPMTAYQIDTIDIVPGTAKPISLKRVNRQWVIGTIPADLAAVNEFLDGLEVENISGFAGDSLSEPKAYGLDNPTYQFTIKSGKDVREVIIGKKDKAGWFAMSKDEPTVFILSNTFVTDLPKAQEVFYSREILALSTDEIQSLTMHKKQRVASLNRNPTTGSWALSANTQGVLLPQNLQATLSLLENLRATTVVPPGQNPVEIDKPDAIIELKTKEGTRRLKVGAETAKKTRLLIEEGKPTIYEISAETSRTLLMDIVLTQATAK